LQLGVVILPISSPITLLTPLRRQLELAITQAPGGEFSHDGDLYYGWDFAGASSSLFGEDVLAIDDGTVVFVDESVPDGGPTSGSFGDDTVSALDANNILNGLEGGDTLLCGDVQNTRGCPQFTIAARQQDGPAAFNG